MTGKIVALTPNGEYTTKFGKLTTKTKVTFADGKQYTFGSIGEFKFKVGEEIKYEVTNEDYKNARVIYDKPETFNKPLNTNQSILRQVAFKGAIELCTSNKITLEQIERTTEHFYTKILNK